jgi:hypothetical protein
MTAGEGFDFTRRSPLPVGRRFGWLWAVPAQAVRAIAKETRLVFLAVLACNLVVAQYLVFHLDYLVGDALSRVADAYFVLFSRDPHLAAIGMIWNPLPSFLELPLVAFKEWFPWLVTRGFAGNIETALFGAGCAVVVSLLLRDAGVGLPLRLAFLAVWVLNPMVLLYSANGMSDILLMFFLLLASLLLLRWFREPRDSLLVGLGVTCAIATLVRYEAWPFAILILLAVAVTQWRSGASWRATEARLLLLGLPVAFAVLFWIGTNAVVMHNPLYFLNGAYSNLSQTKAAAIRLDSWSTAARIVASEVVHLYPAYPVCAVVALALAIWRRQTWVGLAVVLMTTAALLLMTYLIHRGGLELLLRYFMSAIPFSFVLVAYSLGLVRRRIPKVALGVALMALLAVSDLASLGPMSSSRVGPEEHAVVAAVKHDRPMANDHIYQELRVGQAVERLDPEHKLVLIDTFEGFSIVVSSPDPNLFVITSDIDFEAALSDPQAYHIAYFMVPMPEGVGKLDAVNRRYPGFWKNGDGFAKKVADLGTAVNWRLYRIVQPAPL